MGTLPEWIISGRLRYSQNGIGNYDAWLNHANVIMPHYALNIKDGISWLLTCPRKMMLRLLIL